MSDRPSTVFHMKIYSVTVLGKAGAVTRHLWQSYPSACQSFGCWERKNGEGNVVLEAVHVPDDAWKPVDRDTETRLNRVAVLWDQLTAVDPDGLDALLDELVKRVHPPTKAAPPPVLSVQEKDAAMEALNRLANA